MVARLTDLGWGQRLRTLLGDDGVGGTVDLEAPGIEEDPDAAFEVPVRRSSLRPAPGRRAAAGVRAGARRVGLGAAAGRRGRHALAAPAAAGHRGGGGAGPARPAALPGRAGPGARRPDRRPGRNSAFRLAAVWERIVVGHELRGRLAELGSAPVLLVDDLVDSRWTITVAGRELRRAGAAAVLPFALALTA